MLKLRIAIIHDWLVNYAGAERVIEQMLICFPDADIFTTIDLLEGKERKFLQNKKTITTFIQRLPLAKSKYRSYFPLMPYAIEQLDVSKYDIVISSSHAVAKGVLVGPDQLHICYCHTPVRYAWDLQHQYLQESGFNNGLIGFFIRWFLHSLRLWDVRTANGVDHFFANSYFIARRIEKVYRREAKVIYPPVDVESFELCELKGNYYLTASRMVPYKKVSLIVNAFLNMPQKKLIVIGDGPDFEQIKKLSRSNVKVMGYQSFEVLKSYMQEAKAFVFAAEEDFGITLIEAQACGTPVIAFGKGGALETIKGLNHPEPTGVFFYEQSYESIIGAINLFELNINRIKPTACRENALRFSQVIFRNIFLNWVTEYYKDFSEKIKRNAS
jgi:glycosyltransferase involved in cell wall biosynthesis